MQRLAASEPAPWSPTDPVPRQRRKLVASQLRRADVRSSRAGLRYPWRRRRPLNCSEPGQLDARGGFTEFPLVAEVAVAEPTLPFSRPSMRAVSACAASVRFPPLTHSLLLAPAPPNTGSDSRIAAEISP